MTHLKKVGHCPLIGRKIGAFDCLQLLQTMELNENEDEDMEEQLESDITHVIQDDEETIQLPEEWIFEVQGRNQSPSLIIESSDSASKNPRL